MIRSAVFLEIIGVHCIPYALCIAVVFNVRKFSGCPNTVILQGNHSDTKTVLLFDIARLPLKAK